MKTPSLLIVLLFAFFSFNCKQEEKTTPITDAIKSKTDSITPIKKENIVENRYLYGIDISHYQGDEIDLITRKSDSLTFIICKATEGITYTDPDFHNNWEAITEKGFIKGAYHFYRTIDDPKQQAANFLNAISTLTKNNLPPIVDFEEGGIDTSQSVETIQSSLLEFLNSIETKTNRKPMIYTDINTSNIYLNNSKFSNYPLWIANYTEAEQPDLPTTWQNKGWAFWQKSENYTINSTTNDFDIFNGDLKALHTFIENN